MVELVDTPDLKSCAHLGVRVQVPLRVQSSDDKSELFSFKALRIVPIAIGIHLREIKASAFVLGFSFLWMATVYIIYSKSIDKFYVGSCLRLIQRLDQNNPNEYKI